MSLTTVSISVPDTVGDVSTWVSSTIKQIESFGLLASAAATDAVMLCATNDADAPVTADLAIASLSGFGGNLNQSEAGTRGKALGAWLFYAVIRTGGSTTGLSFEIAGGA